MAAARAHGSSALGRLELSLDRPAEVVQLLRQPERVRLVAGGVGEPGAIRFVPDEYRGARRPRPGGRGGDDRRLVRRARVCPRPGLGTARRRCAAGVCARPPAGRGDKALACFEDALALHEHASSIPVRAGPHAAPPRRDAAPLQAEVEGAPYARRRARDLRGARRESLVAESAGGAREHRRTDGVRRRAHPGRGPAWRRSWPRVGTNRGGGGGALRLRPHGRVPPDADLPQARRPPRAPSSRCMHRLRGVARAKPGGFHVSGPFEAS